jgi:hypothetical protein
VGVSAVRFRVVNLRIVFGPTAETYTELADCCYQKPLGLSTQFLKSYPSRPVRRSQDAAFALRATARPRREGHATAKRRRDEGGTGRSTNAGNR